MKQNKAKIKAGLRQKCKKIRANIDAVLREQASQKITQNVTNLEVWKRAQKVHIYVNMYDEVATNFLIQQALKSKKTVICPSQKASSIEENYVVYAMEDVQKIQCSQQEKLQKWNGDIDVILLPLLAFDPTGNRLGFGSGWYDSFCINYGKATKIGLAFAAQKVQKIPSENHDVLLDAIATEENTIMLKT